MDKQQAEKLYNIWETDVLAFAEDVFPHYLTVKSAPFHKTIYETLPKHKFQAIEVFRGGAKSTIGLIIYAIHHALFNKTGDISLISKSEDFIRNEIARKIKWEFEKNKVIRHFWGNLKTSKWTETYFVIKNGIAFEGGGIGGQLRGGRRGLIMLDDLEDEESALSEEQRDKLRRRVNKELIPKLLPTAQMIYFGTPVSLLCYLQQIIDIPDNGWHKLIFPAYKDRVEKEGYELWPEMFPHSRLQEIKRIMGSNYFSAEYLCNPISDETAPIKDYQIRYWDKLPDQVNTIIVIDPAYSEDISADFKVASVIASDSQLNRYLVTYHRTHQPLGEFEDAIINLYLQFKGTTTALGIPSGGTEKGFLASFLKKCQERNVNPPIQELKNVFIDPRTEVSRRSKKDKSTISNTTKSCYN